MIRYLTLEEVREFLRLVLEQPTPKQDRAAKANAAQGPAAMPRGTTPLFFGRPTVSRPQSQATQAGR
jgi:hypothetical protein